MSKDKSLDDAIINTLKKQGYYVSFFYGGDPMFNNMEHFLVREGVNFIQRGFPEDYQKISIQHSGYSWGYNDGDLYARSFEILDSISAGPRLDIYLTLSLHAPFLVPDDGQYDNRFNAILEQMDLNETDNYLDVFSDPT